MLFACRCQQSSIISPIQPHSGTLYADVLRSRVQRTVGQSILGEHGVQHNRRCDDDGDVRQPQNNNGTPRRKRPTARRKGVNNMAIRIIAIVTLVVTNSIVYIRAWREKYTEDYLQKASLNMFKQYAAFVGVLIAPAIAIFSIPIYSTNSIIITLAILMVMLFATIKFKSHLWDILD